MATSSQSEKQLSGAMNPMPVAQAACLRAPRHLAAEPLRRARMPGEPAGKMPALRNWTPDRLWLRFCLGFSLGLSVISLSAATNEFVKSDHHFQYTNHVID